MICLVCAAVDSITTPGVIGGVFIPSTDEGRTAVLLLRQMPVQPECVASLAYFLCQEHSTYPPSKIEEIILGTAAMVGRQ